MPYDKITLIKPKKLNSTETPYGIKLKVSILEIIIMLNYLIITDK